MAITDTITQQEAEKPIATYQGYKLYSGGRISGLLPTEKVVEKIDPLGRITRTRIPTGLPELATRQDVISAGYGAQLYENVSAVLSGRAADFGEATKITTLEREAQKRAAGITPESLAPEPKQLTQAEKIQQLRGMSLQERFKGLSATAVQKEITKEQAQVQALKASQVLQAQRKTQTGQVLTTQERSLLNLEAPTGRRVTLTKYGTTAGGLTDQPIGYGGISEAQRYGAGNAASQVDATLRNTFGGIDIVQERKVGDDYVIKLSKDFKGKAGIEQFQNAIQEAKKFNKYTKVVKVSDTEYRFIQTFPTEQKVIQQPVKETIIGEKVFGPQRAETQKKIQTQTVKDIDESITKAFGTEAERDVIVSQAFGVVEPKPTDIVTVTSTDPSTGEQKQEKMTYRLYLLKQEEADIFNQAFERDVKLKEELGILSDEQLGPQSPQTLVEYARRSGEFSLTPSFEGETATPTFTLKTKDGKGESLIGDYQFAKVFESGGKEVGALYGEEIPQGAFGTQKTPKKIEVTPTTTEKEKEIVERVFKEGELIEELQGRFEKSTGIPQIDFYPIKGVKEFSSEVSTKIRETAVTIPGGIEFAPIKLSLYVTAGVTSIPAMFVELPEFTGKTIVAAKGIGELVLAGEEEAFKERARGSRTALYSVATDPSFYAETAGAVLGLGLIGAAGRGGTGRITSPKAKSVDVFAFIETEAKVTSNILTTKTTPKGLGELPATLEQIAKLKPKEPVGVTELTGKARGFVRGEPELGFIERIKGEAPKERLLGEFDIEFKQEKFTKPQDLPSEGIPLKNIEAVTEVIGEVKVGGKKAPIELKQFTKEQLVEPAFDYDITGGRFLGGKGGVPDIFKKQAIPEARISQPQKLSFTYTLQKGKPISESFGYSEQIGTIQTRLGEAALTAGELFKLEKTKLGEPTTARGITFDVRGKPPRSLDFYFRELSLKEAQEGFGKAVKMKKPKPTPEQRVQLPKEAIQQILTKTEQLYLEAPFQPPKGAFVFGERIFAVPRATPKVTPPKPSQQVEVGQAGGMVQIQKTVQQTKTVTQQLQKQQQVTLQETTQQAKVSTQQNVKQLKQFSSTRTKQLQQVFSTKQRLRGLSKITPITLPKQTPITLTSMLAGQATKLTEKTRQKQSQREKQRERLKQRELQPQLDLQKQLEKTLTATRQPTVTKPPVPFNFPPFTPEMRRPPGKRLILLLPWEEQQRRKKKKETKKFKRKFGYRPDIVTQALGITATEVKRGDVLTGLGLRPRIVKKRRK